MENEKGFTLIEVIIAIALIGVLAVAFFSALGTASLGLVTADERTSAESLARSEIEYVKNEVYYAAPWSYELPSTPPPWDASRTLPSIYDGYSVNVTATLIHAGDDGIQKLTVTVDHDDEVITLIGYKKN